MNIFTNVDYLFEFSGPFENLNGFSFFMYLYKILIQTTGTQTSCFSELAVNVKGTSDCLASPARASPEGAVGSLVNKQQPGLAQTGRGSVGKLPFIHSLNLQVGAKAALQLLAWKIIQS